MKIYEDNFRRLMLLMPRLKVFAELSHCTYRQDGLHVDVLEKHKYTTVVKLTQNLPLNFLSTAVSSMVVRVYHDAEVAEVLSYQRQYRFKAKYDYPNPEMCQVREKLRVNEFLGEWLDFCLAGGTPVRAVAMV